jgi:hypothetical protein
MALVLSCYAAVVATAALCWQVVIWRRARRTIVEAVLGVDGVLRFRETDPEPRVLIFLRIVNRSEFPVTVERAMLRGYGPHAAVREAIEFTSLPGQDVAANDGVTSRLDLDPKRLDWNDGVRASIQLGSGITFTSSTEYLPSDLDWWRARANRSGVNSRAARNPHRSPHNIP